MKATKNVLSFNTSQEAWEGINEYLFKKEEKLVKLNKGFSSNVIEAYNCLIFIRKAWVNPEFDFNFLFGYKIQKWNSLISNYVNKNYLDLVANDIRIREKKNQSTYNVTLHFDNAHAAGKDCLISLTFQRRKDLDVPVLLFNLRASEVTKRLLWDLLLIQRMGEYVYGEHKTFAIYIFCGNMHLNPEAFTMYHKHRDLNSLIKNSNKLGKNQKKILELLAKFKTIDPESLSYKVHRRSVKQLQSLPNGNKLLVKNLKLEKTENIEYPENCLSDVQRKAYRKKMNIKR